MQSGLAALVRGVFTMVFAMIASAASAATYMYVGNAGANEIVVLSLDPKTGDLKEIEKIAVPGITKAGGSIPMAVSPNKKFLYAGFRGEPLAVAAFAIDAKTGKLRHLGNGTLAHSMAYIATDRSGKFLLSASYPGHMVTVNPIGAGRPGAGGEADRAEPAELARDPDRQVEQACAVAKPRLGLGQPVQVRCRDRNADAERAARRPRPPRNPARAISVSPATRSSSTC